MASPYSYDLRAKAIAGYQKGKRPKIKNLQSFEKFVLQHNNKTQQRIAQLWGNSLTQQNVSDAMRKLGITRKKRSDPASPKGVYTRMGAREC